MFFHNYSHDANTDTYNQTCSCGCNVSLDGNYVREFPTAATEHAQRLMADGCICPDGEVYTNLSGNTRIRIAWTPENLAEMRSVKLERKAMSSQIQSHVVPTALNYGQGWEFYNRPVYTPPTGEPGIWIEF